MKFINMELIFFLSSILTTYNTHTQSPSTWMPPSSYPQISTSNTSSSNQQSYGPYATYSNTSQPPLHASTNSQFPLHAEQTTGPHQTFYNAFQSSQPVSTSNTSSSNQQSYGPYATYSNTSQPPLHASTNSMFTESTSRPEVLCPNLPPYDTIYSVSTSTQPMRTYSNEIQPQSISIDGPAARSPSPPQQALIIRDVSEETRKDLLNIAQKVFPIIQKIVTVNSRLVNLNYFLAIKQKIQKKIDLCESGRTEEFTDKEIVILFATMKIIVKTVDVTKSYHGSGQEVSNEPWYKFIDDLKAEYSKYLQILLENAPRLIIKGSHLLILITKEYEVKGMEYL